MATLVQKNINLYAGHATPKNVILRALPVPVRTSTRIWLYAGHSTPKNIVLSSPIVARPYTPPPSGGFNPQLMMMGVGA